MNPQKDSFHIGAGISSMTGFGRNEKTFPGLCISVEVRSVNNRYCDIGMRIPRELNALESGIRERIRTRLTRGRISLLITLDRHATEDSPLKIDFQAANVCYQKLEELNQSLETPGPVTLGQLLHFSEFFTQQMESTLDHELKQQVLEVLDGALDNLVNMRRSEGISLAKDLLGRLNQAEKIREKIEKLAAEQPKLQMERMRDRLDVLVTSGPIDPGRLEQEMAMMADRLDITEECVRLKSHNQRFLEALGSDEPAGKRLGFLLQEMNREANTISAKSASADISHLSVNLKEEIERAREQIQNLE